MATTQVWVPDALLFNQSLGKSAKVLWMVHRLDSQSEPAPASPSPSALGARSGLSRHTVLRGLAQLRSEGWLAAAPTRQQGARQDGTWVPRDLLLDHRVPVQARLLYACLGRTPGFQSPNGQFTYTALRDRTGAGINTLKRAVRALQETGWLAISQRNKFSPIHFVLRNPPAERCAEAMARAERRLNQAEYKGEALMREFLSVLVNNDEYDDDASPGFLLNPLTGEELQFDRYYPPKVAFEYNGRQHYGPTDRYADEAAVRNRQARDYIKMGISWARGIHLAVVHAEDLTLQGIRQKVEGLLPLRNLDGLEPLIAYLEKVSRAYRRKTPPTSPVSRVTPGLSRKA